MDWDLSVKLATFILGVIGAAKILYEIAIGNRIRMREEYEFARDFFGELHSDREMHPFVKEKGYQAIAGDNRLSADEIEYLVSLERSDRALRDYVLGLPYLEHLPEVGNLEIAFKKKYRRKWSRWWRIVAYALLYAGSALLAFAPLIFAKFLFHTISNLLLTFAGCLAVFGTYAWVSLKSASRIYRAEKLVLNQHKHTQAILVNSSSRSLRR